MRTPLHSILLIPNDPLPEEATKMLDALKDDRLSALYSAALAVGLRQGEAPGLRWPDIDFEPDNEPLRARDSGDAKGSCRADGRVLKPPAADTVADKGSASSITP